MLLISAQLLTAQNTFTSVRSGNWNDCGTWGGNNNPDHGDVVTIAAGHTVTVPENTAFEVGSVKFAATTSHLKMAGVNSQLRYTATDRGYVAGGCCLFADCNQDAATSNPGIVIHPDPSPHQGVCHNLPPEPSYRNDNVETFTFSAPAGRSLNVNQLSVIMKFEGNNDNVSGSLTVRMDFSFDGNQVYTRTQRITRGDTVIYNTGASDSSVQTIDITMTVNVGDGITGSGNPCSTSGGSQCCFRITELRSMTSVSHN